MYIYIYIYAHTEQSGGVPRLYLEAHDRYRSHGEAKGGNGQRDCSKVPQHNMNQDMKNDDEGKNSTHDEDDDSVVLVMVAPVTPTPTKVVSSPCASPQLKELLLPANTNNNNNHCARPPEVIELLD